jgi:WD40 repeat protein
VSCEGCCCQQTTALVSLGAVAAPCPAPWLLNLCRSPQHADVFLSASGDTTVRVWDLRQPAPTLTLAAHAFEVRRRVVSRTRLAQPFDSQPSHLWLHRIFLQVD